MEHFLGNESLTAYMAFIFFLLFGMFYIKLIRYNKKKKEGLRSNPVKFVRFNLRIWLDDNLLDFIIAFMTGFACFRFFPDAFSFVNNFVSIPEYTDKMFYGFLLGLFFQTLFHKIFNASNLEVFKAK